MALKITLKAFRENEGLKDETDWLTYLEGLDAVVPALCEDGCEVEPDGECEHGNPSVLRAAGFI